MSTSSPCDFFFFFFFNDTATTEIYTLSLHDALPICVETTGTSPSALASTSVSARPWLGSKGRSPWAPSSADRKSTRLNSSHGYISYAVFCLKKKKNRHRRLPSWHITSRRSIPILITY